MKKIEQFYRLNLVIMLTTVLLLSSVSSVQAATTGSQIKVAACSASRVIIKGKNQTGISVTYTLNNSASNCIYINIPGMWWNGVVTATAYYNVSSEYPYYNGQSVSVTIPTTQSSNYYPVTFSTPTARQWILWRAQTWINDHVAYNQSSTHDGYRQDCSGYVSFTWQLTKPGTSPSGMSAYSYQIPFDSLQPGDALNNPSAHTMLFIKWVDQSQGTFIAYDEENPTSGTRQRTLTLNKSTGVIKQSIYYTYPGYYKAIRKNGL
jgi:hypothetical protein